MRSQAGWHRSANRNEGWSDGEDEATRANVLHPMCRGMKVLQRTGPAPRRVCRLWTTQTLKRQVRCRTWSWNSCLGIVARLLIASFPTSTLVASFLPHSPVLFSANHLDQCSANTPRFYSLHPLTYTMRLSGGSSNSKHSLSPKSDPSAKRRPVIPGPLLTCLLCDHRCTDISHDPSIPDLACPDTGKEERCG
eukprot:1432973-Rhodomonas_salina.3